MPQTRDYNKQNYYPITLDLVFGSQVNLEMVYSAYTYVTSKGVGSVNHTFVSPQLLLDIPFFYTLNKSFTDFGQNAFNTILQIGTNLRYEASLLNTRLRREQSRRGIAYITFGAFSSLRYSQQHQGNSFRSLYASYENRAPFAKNQYLSQKELAIVIGVNACRHNYSRFFQQLVVNIGKMFFIKTSQKDRLGVIHSSVGSLAFSHLGFYSKKQHAAAQLTFAQPAYKQNYNLNTFRGTSGTLINREQNLIIGGKTLYETNGSLIAVHGQRRKHIKVVNELKLENLKSNFEVNLISF
jgi:hypothetical protein